MRGVGGEAGSLRSAICGYPVGRRRAKRSGTDERRQGLTTLEGPALDVLRQPGILGRPTLRRVCLDNAGKRESEHECYEDGERGAEMEAGRRKLAGFRPRGERGSRRHLPALNPEICSGRDSVQATRMQLMNCPQLPGQNARQSRCCLEEKEGGAW